jgi:hypothetical protein
MYVGPHPHIGLQTFTWLIEGDLLHRDSLGCEQLLRPGQVNLMTARRSTTRRSSPTGCCTPRRPTTGSTPARDSRTWIARSSRG